MHGNVEQWLVLACSPRACMFFFLIGDFLPLFKNRHVRLIGNSTLFLGVSGSVTGLLATVMVQISLGVNDRIHNIGQLDKYPGAHNL